MLQEPLLISPLVQFLALPFPQLSLCSKCHQILSPGPSTCRDYRQTILFGCQRRLEFHKTCMQTNAFTYPKDLFSDKTTNNSDPVVDGSVIFDYRIPFLCSEDCLEA